MANSYQIGTLVRMTSTFSVSGVDTNPGSVVGTVKDPAGVETNPAVVQDSTGVYHMDFTTALAGVHYYKFAGSVGLTVTGQSAFVVVPSNL